MTGTMTRRRRLCGSTTVEVTKQGRWWPYRTVRFCERRDEIACALWQAWRDKGTTLVRILDAEQVVVAEYRRPGR